MDYQLKSPGKSCAKTGAVLSPGQTVYSALLEQAGRFVRVDYSEDGWDGPPQEAIGHWKHALPPATANRPKPLDPESLLQCFEQLDEESDLAREKLKFVIGLLLVQKRRLTLEGGREDGEICYLQLAGSHGEGPFEVREFELTDEERQELQAAVNALLYEPADE